MQRCFGYDSIRSPLVGGGSHIAEMLVDKTCGGFSVYFCLESSRDRFCSIEASVAQAGECMALAWFAICPI